MHYKLAKTATAWWVTAIKDRYYTLYSKELVSTDPFSKELSRFETILFNEILSCIQNQGHLSLTCCFRPNRELSKLVERADFSTIYLPLQASMQICGRSVEVSINQQIPYKLRFSI